MRFEKFMDMVNSGQIKCGKIRYESKHLARTALKSAQSARKSAFSKVEKRVYSCDKCSGWHLTSKERHSEKE